MASQRSVETDCSSHCRSVEHGDKVTTALTCGRSVNQKLLWKYLATICHNFCLSKDRNGRNALQTASACGKEKVVEVLLKVKEVQINARDAESGVSALHLALFHGQLHVARNLIQAGSNIYQGDNNNLLPMDYVTKDRLPRLDYSVQHVCEAYVWGTNANFTIGQGHTQNKMLPELLESFRRDAINVKTVAISKFHSVFVDSAGLVYTCGHGQGGRLGLDSELAAIYPVPIKSLSDEVCVMVAVGLDHTVLLMESGHVFTFGTNAYHQLALNPPPSVATSPKQIPPIIKSGKVEIRIKGVAASRFHTVFWSNDSIFTCGLNAGHLGHLKGEKMITVPKQVTSLILKETGITHVVASEGATLVATNKGDIYVLHEYQTRKIASKQHDLDKVYMIGGHLDPKAHPDLLKESGGRGLQVAVLSKVGKISVWTERTQVLTRCVTNLGRPITIVDVALSLSGFLIISSEGEGYMGTHIPKKERRNTVDSSSQDGSSRVLVKNHSSALVERVEREHCDQLKLKRIPNIHRGVSAACDIKGTNFCVIQTHPSASLLEIPQVSRSEMRSQMGAFFEESLPDDYLHDLVFEVGYHQFAAHKYVLGCRAESLLTYALENGRTDEMTNEVICKIDDVPSSVLEQLLRYIYTGTCKPLEPGSVLRDSLVPQRHAQEENVPVSNGSANGVYSSNKKKKKTKTTPKPHTEDPQNHDHLLQPYKDAARHFGLYKLVKHLEEVTVIDCVVRIKNPRLKSLGLPEPRFARKWREELSDVVMVSEDGRELEAHRCVLAARLEYFRSMFGLGWIETSSTRRIPLPLPFDLLEVIVDYLYEDDSKLLRRIDDVEFICNVIVVADQFLIGRLKEICEEVVTGLITLKNVTEILQFADTYNALQLKRVCMEYVCLNLSAIFEARSLELLSESLMDEISEYYRETNRAVGHRYVTPKTGAPTEKTLESLFGVEADEDSGSEEFQAVYDSTKPKKSRAPKARRRTDSTGNRDVAPESISSPKTSSIREPPSPSHAETLVGNAKYKWSKVTSGSRRRQNSTSKDEKSILITPVKEKSQEPENRPTLSVTPKAVLPVVHSSPVISVKTPVKIVAPVQVAVAPVDAPAKPSVVAFPALSEAVHVAPAVKSVLANNVTQATQSHSPASAKKPVKLSQKQRKQLAAQGVLAPNAIFPEPSTAVAPWTAAGHDVEMPQPIASAWGKMEETPSFAEILRAEEERRRQLEKPVQSPVIHRSAPVPVARKEPASPRSPIGSPPFPDRLGGPNVRLSDIMEEEAKQRDMLLKVKAKPLRLTQIEDQAIEELLEFYGANQCFDERISVVRVTSSVAAPTWFR